MHTYVINLSRSPERREHITSELRKTGLGYDIVPGVDGRELDLDDVDRIAPALFDRSSYPAGMAGCALSHLRVYERILADGVDAAVVLEDDVTLPADLGSLAEAVAGHMAGAELALLNYDSQEAIRMSRGKCGNLLESRLLGVPLGVPPPPRPP